MTGRGTELSHGGMALHTGIDLEPDDLLEVEFRIPDPLRVMATVRNRSGYYFGLEFLAVLPQQASRLPKNRPSSLPKPPAKIAGNENITDAHLIKKVFAALHRKALEIKRVQREIDALLTAAALNSPPSFPCVSCASLNFLQFTWGDNLNNRGMNLP